MAKNFKYLDDLIHSGVKEIFLDSDIILDDGEESNYKKGIELDVDNLVIFMEMDILLMQKVKQEYLKFMAIILQ